MAFTLALLDRASKLVKRGWLAALAIAVVLPASTSLAKPVPVRLNIEYPVGSIVIVPSRFVLYFIEEDRWALRYPIGAPKKGKGWTETEGYVTQKDRSPAWAAPDDLLKDKPKLKGVVIPGGAKMNPMGAAAISLSLTEIAIHGTPESWRNTIGKEVSYGCIRMLNEDVLDLFDRVQLQAPVYMR